MPHATSRLFIHKLSGDLGRPQNGRWLRAMPAHKVHELLDPDENSTRGGRINPPGSFRVLYAAEDEEGCRPRILECLDDSAGTVVAIFETSLSRILDLTDAWVRRKLGVSVRDLSNGDDPRIAQALGIAAYNEGFEGVIYPRPSRPKCRNLAIFTDRVTSDNIRLIDILCPAAVHESR
jgi:RES domain-containing protein